MENKAYIKEEKIITSIDHALSILKSEITFNKNKICATTTCGKCAACAFKFLENSVLSIVTQDDKDKFKKALAANGEEYYANALQEEAAELIQAISHIRRKRENAKNKTIVEMAQVFIILEIYKMAIFPLNQEEIHFKEVFNKELNRIIWDAENGVVHSEGD